MRAARGEVTHLYAYMQEGGGVVNAMLPSGWGPAMTYDPQISDAMLPAMLEMTTERGGKIYRVTAAVMMVEEVQHQQPCAGCDAMPWEHPRGHCTAWLPAGAAMAGSSIRERLAALPRGSRRTRKAVLLSGSLSPGCPG